MLHELLAQDITAYVNRAHFRRSMNIQTPIHVQFLAQGEYNLNYLLETDSRNYVLRVNTGSQMSLANQIQYEYQALQLLKPSGVTPLPYYLDDLQKEIPYGLLVMEYLPGAPLNYYSDLSGAAVTFARIHSISFNQGENDFLVKAKAPFSAILSEANNLLTRYFDCSEANPEVKDLLERIYLFGEEKRKEESYFLKEPWHAVINTEVNSHNFIVNQEKKSCHLIDWEKPIYGEPAQDLSMFLIRTTTLWKADVLLSAEQEDLFLKSYTEELIPCPYVQTLPERVRIFKFFNTLRALSWCAMAWTEYIKPGRPLVNKDTFEKINMYLEPNFIKGCFPEIF
ncbi:phosphotransferase [Desulfitobacterium sp. AusDCA]|uniref:phosphotransferase n=1 Tax=Desulfitobacterium sp. AusDCA TaxID=3240383 RepID=UPI003DA781FE